MKTQAIMALPLLAAACLTDCSDPVDQETQAKARAVALAKAVRQPKEEYSEEEGRATNPDESVAEEPQGRGREDKGD